MKKTIGILAGAILAIISQSIYASEFRLDKPFFAVHLPEDWRVLNDSEVIAALSTAQVRDDEFKSRKIAKGNNALLTAISGYAFLSVQHRPYGPVEGLSEEEIINKVFERAGSLYEQTTIVKNPSASNMGGLSGAHGIMDYVEKNKNGSHQAVRYESWIFRKDDSMYSVVTKYRANNMEAAKMIDSIVKGMRFIDLED